MFSLDSFLFDEAKHVQAIPKCVVMFAENFLCTDCTNTNQQMCKINKQVCTQYYSCLITQTSVSVVTRAPRPGEPAPPRSIPTDHAPNYFKVTLINMVICCLCGGLVGTVLLIPALICAYAVSAYVV